MRIHAVGRHGTGDGGRAGGQKHLKSLLTKWDEHLALRVIQVDCQKATLRKFFEFTVFSMNANRDVSAKTPASTHRNHSNASG
jgi:hypothetical protein